MCYPQSLFLSLFLALLVASPSSSEVTNEKYTACAPTANPCGDHGFNISFPFRFGDRPEYCGYPGFDLTCSADKSKLMLKTSGGMEYQVNGIDYTDQVVHVVDPNLAGQSCPANFSNASLDFSLFNYTAQDLNLIVVHSLTSGFGEALQGGFEVMWTHNFGWCSGAPIPVGFYLGMRERVGEREGGISREGEREG